MRMAGLQPCPSQSIGLATSDPWAIEEHQKDEKGRGDQFCESQMQGNGHLTVAADLQREQEAQRGE